MDFGKQLLNAKVLANVTLDSTDQPNDNASTRVTVGGATVGDLTFATTSTVFNGSTMDSRQLSGTLTTMIRGPINSSWR